MSWMSHNPDAIDTYIEAYLVEKGFQKETGDWQECEQDFQTPAEALEHYCPNNWSALLGEFEQYYFEDR